MTEIIKRILAKDPLVWSNDPQTPEIGNRLDWIDLPETMLSKVDEIISFSTEIKEAGFQEIVLLGMGGSSLAPEVFMKIFRNKGGYPFLTVLDTTHPESIKAITDRLDLKKTLFIVSSKSGGTIETISLFKLFFKKLGKDAGKNFVAITDPGSKLEKIALEKKFRKVFSAPPGVGGRFSALSYFGLLPAGLIGVDIKEILERAQKKDLKAVETIGNILGKAGLSAQNKVHFKVAEEFSSLLDWIEQLIAESTGKDGKGVVPISKEFSSLKEIISIDLNLKDKYDLGKIFFELELATAFAGHLMKINPFNQPNVELSKEKARKLIKDFQEELSTSETSLKEFMAQKKADDYISILAWIPYNKENDKLLENLSLKLSQVYQLPVTCGYGPRYLHSTGQLYKGDGNQGLFIEIIDVPQSDLEIPDENYTFKTLFLAQALGDLKALQEKERRVITINLRDLD